MNTTHSVVFGQYAFIAYPLVSASQGASAIEVSAKNDGINLNAIQKTARANASVRVVFRQPQQLLQQGIIIRPLYEYREEKWNLKLVMRQSNEKP